VQYGLDTALYRVQRYKNQEQAIKAVTDDIEDLSNRKDKSDVISNALELYKIVLKILNDTKEIKYTNNSTLFSVDILENEFLLNEQESFQENNKKVKSAIKRIFKEIGYKVSSLNYMNGREIYKTIAAELGSEKAASEKLNEYGIKGIKYDGLRDGECFVIFDDKAVDIINKYNQGEQHGNKYYQTAYQGKSYGKGIKTLKIGLGTLS